MSRVITNPSNKISQYTYVVLNDGTECTIKGMGSSDREYNGNYASICGRVHVRGKCDKTKSFDKATQNRVLM